MIKTKIISKRSITDTICELTLGAVDGTSLPSWQAGSHIDLHLPNGFIRQYSLCGLPNTAKYKIAVLKDANGRGGSACVHEQLNEGDSLEISAPRNLFPLAQAKGPSLFFAAGIGITPILPMLMSRLIQGQPVALYYCVKSSQQAAYLAELGELLADDALHLHASGEHGSRLNLAECFTNITPNTHVYVCGPSGFIEDVLKHAQEAALPKSQLHSEYFSVNAAEQSESEGFEVEIASSGQIIQVNEDASIISALEEADVFVPVSCEAGICGTCVTGLKAGEADHRDSFLSDEEKQSMTLIMPCCSRAKSARLVLDI